MQNLGTNAPHQCHGDHISVDSLCNPLTFNPRTSSRDPRSTARAASPTGPPMKDPCQPTRALQDLALSCTHAPGVPVCHRFLTGPRPANLASMHPPGNTRAVTISTYIPDAPYRPQPLCTPRVFSGPGCKKRLHPRCAQQFTSCLANPRGPLPSHPGRSRTWPAPRRTRPRRTCAILGSQPTHNMQQLMIRISQSLHLVTP